MQDKFYDILNNSKSILINCFARVGDAVVTLILVDNLGYYLKDKNIYLISSDRNYEIFRNNKFVKKIYTWPDKIETKEKMDLVIFLASFDNKRDYPVYKFLRENLERAIFLGYVKNELEGYGFDICIYHAKKGSIIERVSNLAKFLTQQKDLIRPHIDVSPEVEKELQDFIKINNGGKKLVHLNISAGDKTSLRSYLSRNLPLSTIDNLINFLAKHNLICFVTAAPWDKWKFEYLKNKYAKFSNIIFVETPSLSHLIAVIKIAGVVITPETSVVHIASLLNKKIVGIYDSKKKFKEWPPWSENFEVVIPKIPRFMPSLDFNFLCNKIFKIIYE